MPFMKYYIAYIHTIKQRNPFFLLLKYYINSILYTTYVVYSMLLLYYTIYYFLSTQYTTFVNIFQTFNVYL